MKTHTIQGASSVKLHIREWGSADGIPVLLIHGWSQSHLCWVRQYEDATLSQFRILALDLRGHGMSEAPLETACYSDGDQWAGDIAALLDQLSVKRPVFVGWSYGGYIICDYIRKYGDSGLAGINFVAAGVVLGPKAFGPLIGPGFFENAPGVCEADLPTSIDAARKFLRACIRVPISSEVIEVALASMMVVPPRVRAALIQRELDFAEALETIAVPVLVSQSRQDTMVLPAMSEYILAHCSTATASWYDDIGHAPFLEKPDRFNKELADFARRAFKIAGLS